MAQQILGLLLSAPLLGATNLFGDTRGTATLYGSSTQVAPATNIVGTRNASPGEVTVAQEAFGPLGPIFATDQPSSSAHARQALGWGPTHLSLLEDLENIQP